MSRRPHQTVQTFIAAGDDPASLDRMHDYLRKLKRNAELLAGELREIAGLLDWQRAGETLSRSEKLVVDSVSELRVALRQIRRHTTTIVGTEEQCAAFDERLRPFVEAMGYAATPKSRHVT